MRDTTFLFRATGQTALQQLCDRVRPLSATVLDDGSLAVPDASVRFQLDSPLGGGSFGTVFAATRIAEDGSRQPLACKVSAWADTESVVEAALYQLCSQHDIGPRVEAPFFLKIPKSRFRRSPLLGNMNGSDLSFLFMERFDTDVRQFLRQQRPTDDELRDIETQIRARMWRLVDLGVVCRDQKPANVLVKREAARRLRVVLSDFDRRFCCSLLASPGLQEQHAAAANPCLQRCSSTSGDLVLPLLFTQIHHLEPRLFAAETACAATLLGNDLDPNVLPGDPIVGDPASARYMAEIAAAMDKEAAVCDTLDTFEWYLDKHPLSAVGL
jgi:hypothetical protein